MLERQDLILGGCLEKEEIVGTAAKLIKFCRLLICVVHDTKNCLKIIGKEFQKIVRPIRRYLERSIQKKFFSNLHSLQIKTIFQEKSSICEN